MINWYKWLVDFLFPTYCIGCKSNGVFLCSKCIENSEKSKQNNFSYIHSIFDYKNKTIKRTIWKLKYEEKVTIAEILGQILHDKILEEISEEQLFNNFTSVLVVPIPLSKKAFKKRGFNQSELIATALCEKDKDTYELAVDVLYKIRETSKQMSLKNKTDRLNNLKGAFSVKNFRVKGKDIILIDDITTTGATINEARSTLLSAGAKTVSAYTIAH